MTPTEYAQKLRHAADTIERLGVSVEFVMTADTYCIRIGDFKRAFAGKCVTVTNIDAGRQYQTSHNDVTFFADEHIAEQVTGYVTLPKDAA